MPMEIELRPHQIPFCDGIYAEFDAGHKSVMGVAPTGFGKTICIAKIADYEQSCGHSTFILVHRKELIKQTSKSFRKYGIQHGVIAAGYPLTDTPIQIVSVQTFVRRLHLFNQPYLLVIDETHRCASKTYTQIIEWAKAYSLMLGVTASPIRTDGRGFTEWFTTMVCAADIPELIKLGALSKPDLYRSPLEDMDTSSIPVNKDGEFSQEGVKQFLDERPKIVGSAVEHYKKYCPDMPPTLVFCASVAKAQETAEQFTAAGIPSASIDGSMSDEKREAMIELLATRQIYCLMSCDLISEGFDLQSYASVPVFIQCVILLRPTKSEALMRQQIGRGLRPWAPGCETKIFDHVNNWKIHGRVDAPRIWTLEGRKKRGKKTKGETLTSCPRCYKVFPPCPKCPSCGHDFKVAAVGNGREIQQVEGELVRDSDAAQIEAIPRKRRGPGFLPVAQKLERA